MTLNSPVKIPLTFFVIFFLSIINLDAQWVNNPAANTKLVIGQNDPVNIIALDDKAGGVFVFWEDKKLSDANDIYFIHANQKGEVSFRADGKTVSSSPGIKEHSLALTDNEGSAYVLWKCKIPGEPNSLFVQKLSGNGLRLWGDRGLRVAQSELEIVDYSFDIGDDGLLFISYLVREPGFTGNYQLHYRFLDKNGKSLNNIDEELIVYNSNDRKSKTSVVADFEDGAFFFWLENFSGRSVLRSYFIDSSGSTKWGLEPVNISNINKSVLSYTVNRFGNSVYLSFQYQGQIKEIYHQLITRNGNLLWGTGGSKVNAANGSQLNPQAAIIDSTIYLTWTNEFKNIKDLLIQKFDKNGKALWKKEGRHIIKSEGDQFGQKIIPDQKGNVIIAWIDRSIDSVFGNIHVQKINSQGNFLWDSLSVELGSSYNTQKSYLNLVPDGTGGAIAIFKEKRGGKNEIFAQKIFESGTYASQILAFSAENFDGKVKLSWYSANESPDVIYNVERTVQADTGLADWQVIGTASLNTDRSVNYYELLDMPDTNGTLYYRIVQKDGNQSETVYDLVKINFLESANTIVVAQNSPNPFTDSTVISFYLPEDEDVALEFFDSTVELIKELPRQKYTAGRHEIVFKNENLHPGIYFFRFKAGKHIEVKKMVVSPK